jgi:uncharacterized membrane protein YdjX (TVP38/TMEM64 family)
MSRRNLSLLILLLLCLLALGLLLDVSGRFAGYVELLMDYARQNRVAFMPVFVVLQALSCLSAVVPASVVAIACGVVYGFASGFMLSLSGLLLGAILGFLISRYVFRSTVEAIVATRLPLVHIDRVVSSRGWKAVLLIRLSPVAPFGVTTYLLGLTSISLPQFLVGTAGALPSLFLFIYTGVLANETLLLAGGPHDQLDIVKWVLMLVGLVATVILLWQASRLTKRALEDAKVK